MITVDDLNPKYFPENLRDLTAKERVKTLLYIVGPVTDEALYSVAADEIESLHAQVEELRAGAIICANKQAILLKENARLCAQLMHAHSLVSVMSAPIFEEAQP